MARMVDVRRTREPAFAAGAPAQRSPKRELDGQEVERSFPDNDRAGQAHRRAALFFVNHQLTHTLSSMMFHRLPRPDCRRARPGSLASLPCRDGRERSTPCML